MAQIALTYSYNFKDQKYIDYVCILSVLAQVAIDNAKRRFDIDLNAEIKRIKKDMNLKENGYPEFWGVVKKDFNKKLINPNLKCPMNYLGDINFKKFKAPTSTLPMSNFFIREKIKNTKKAKKVETLIQKYSIDLYNSPIRNQKDTGEEYLLLKDDFNEMIKEIQSLYLSNNCLDLMSWLLDRAFCISPYVKAKEKEIKTVINTNKSLLLSVLYSVSKGNLLKCFSKGVIK